VGFKRERESAALEKEENRLTLLAGGFLSGGGISHSDPDEIIDIFSRLGFELPKGPK